MDGDDDLEAVENKANLDRNLKWSKPAPGGYLTTLSPEDESRFQAWVKSGNSPVPFDPSPSADYDLRGWWKGKMTNNPKASQGVDKYDKRVHVSDYYKTPFHKTFSRQSRWATPNAPSWNDQDQLIDSDGKVLFDDRAQQKRAGGGSVIRGYAGGGPTDDDLIPDDHPDVSGPDDDLIPDDHPAVTPWSSGGAEHYLEAHTPKKDPVIDDRQHAASIPGIARASLPPDTKVQIKRYAHMFKQPETDFMEWKGHVVRRVPETDEWARVEPSVFGGHDSVGGRLDRIGKWMASGVGPAIPRTTGPAAAGAIGLATSEAGPGVAIPAAMAAGSAGQGFGDYLRQKGDQFLADDDTPTDWGNVGWHAAEGMAITPVGKGVEALGRLVGRVPGFFRKAPAGAAVPQEVAENAGASENPLMLPKESIDAIKEHLSGAWDYMRGIAEDAKKLGINLSLGQITRNPEIQAMERTAATWPGGASRFGQRRMEQNNEAVPKAFSGELDSVSPWKPDERGQAVDAFREGAVAAKDKAARDLNAEARTAFKGALDDKDATGKRFWSQDLEDLIKERPSLQRALSYAKSLAREKGDTSVLNIPEYDKGQFVGEATVPTWRGYEWIRKAMRAQLDDPANMNPKTGKPNAMGNLIKQTYDDYMGTLLKANPEWGNALVKYGTDAHDLALVFRGGIKKLADMDQPDRLNMVNQIFSGGGANPLPQDIREMRQAFDKAGKLPEWDAGVRGYLQNALDQATTRTNTGERGNVAGKLLGVWNTQNQKDVLAAAFGDPAKAQRFGRLMDIMDHAAHMLPEGSPTGINREISKTTSSNIAGKAKLAVSTVGTLGYTALDAIDSYLERVKEPAARKKIIDFLLTPDGDQRLKAFLNTTPDPAKVRLAPAGQKKMITGLNALLGAAGIEAGRAASGAAGDNDE